ncbi:MAG: hypothetical protein ACYTXC_11705 [Nostoc sp.]
MFIYLIQSPIQDKGVLRQRFFGFSVRVIGYSPKAAMSTRAMPTHHWANSPNLAVD